MIRFIWVIIKKVMEIFLKSVLVPCQNVDYLGFLVNPRTLKLELPAFKIAGIQQENQDMQMKK